MKDAILQAGKYLRIKSLEDSVQWRCLLLQKCNTALKTLATQVPGLWSPSLQLLRSNVLALFPGAQ